MAGSEADRLLERLLADPEFRARFDADPAGTARTAGFLQIADELARDDGGPMQTLELRESRSSLAGALVAAAADGLALFGHGGRLAAADPPAAQRAAGAGQVGQQQPTSQAAPPTIDPGDLQGNADEDGGADEQDGSDEDEPDEDEDEGDDDEDDEDDDEGDEDDDEDDDDEGDDGDGDEPAGEVAADLTGFRTYPGDNARRAEIAAWMAAAAQRRGLPPELPVMASLVESGLKNHAYGDRDSVGLFQMRTSIWNKGPYKGYPDRPGLQLRWFLDHAEAVKKQRLAAGLDVHDPRQYGDWIADVERPAQEYRGRYQLRLDDARALLERAGEGVAPGVRDGIVEWARSFVGTPYVWGGTSPRGFDCSGFVQYVYERMGVDLPRISAQQANTGRRISLSALKAGDLVAWDNSSRNRGADHIAIYLGGGRIAEAPRPGVDLRIRNLGSNEGAWGVRVLRPKRV